MTAIPTGGRLRWGGDEEAFWGDYFNGAKNKNPWVAHVPPEQLKESQPLEIFGFRIAHWESRIDLRRPFMARFGDITQIEANGRDLRVTLKSGTVFHLDRYEADDCADGIRVWDDRRGVVVFDEGRIRSIELLDSGWLGPVPDRLHGTVRTRQCASPALSSGTARSVSGLTNSTATPPPVSSACVLTPSGPSRATRATVPRDAAIRT
jgi:hypothetical protein